MNEVFADTHYFIALLSPGDSAYEKARAATVSQTATLVTTAWVLTELASALSNRSLRVHFLRTLEKPRSNPTVVIIEPDSALFEAGIALFAARDDKDWTLTDCISFVVMEQRGISDALTGDRHFRQAGFQTLLG
jgi:hypothetical protein